MGSILIAAPKLYNPCGSTSLLAQRKSWSMKSSRGKIKGISLLAINFSPATHDKLRNPLPFRIRTAFRVCLGNVCFAIRSELAAERNAKWNDIENERVTEFAELKLTFLWFVHNTRRNAQMTNSTPLTLKLPSEDAASNQDIDGLKLCKTKTKAAREKARREKMNERWFDQSVNFSHSLMQVCLSSRID